jgi:hypothetical protein
VTEGLVRVGFFLAVCLAAGVVQGATRASEPAGILRHAVRAFISLAGGIALLCAGIALLLCVVQG